MESVLLGLTFGGFLFFTAVILPWVNRGRIDAAEKQTSVIRNQLQELIAFLKTSGIEVPEELAAPKIWSWQHEVAPATVQPPPADDPSPAPVVEAVKIKEPAKPEPQKTVRTSISFEQQFGAHLPVWIGGIALALAGFFLVKYSIEIGLLSPTVRVLLGLIFGGGLLHAADRVRAHPKFANGTRIAQALSGAGIADLYICLFAATNLYGLISPFVGFAGMAAVTATAVLLSLRHGPPIALLGLIGGFLTPMLIGTQEPDAPLLFTYLYFVTGGLLVVTANQAHRWIAVPAVFCSFLWVVAWLCGGHFAAGDGLWLGLFLIAICATVVGTSKREEDTGFTMALHYTTLCGAIVLMGIIVAHANFGLMEWSLFALLSIGTVALAAADQPRYGYAPMVTMVTNAVMLLGWHTIDEASFALILTGFGALYAVSGFLLQSRRKEPLLWAGLTASTSIIFYLIGYQRLHGSLLLVDIPYIWGGLAVVFAALGAGYVQHLLREDHPQKQSLLAIHATTVTAFLSLALTIELPHDYLAVAIALQLLAVTWIDTKLEVKALRPIAGALACVFGVLLIPQILLLIQLTAYSLIEAKLMLQKGIPMVDSPLYQLGLPALCFIGAGYLLRQRKDDKLVRVFEIAAIALVATMGYYLTRHAFHIDADVLFVKAGFFERGVTTNILFIYGLVCLWSGRHLLRRAVVLSGQVLCGIALFRLAYFDLLAYNPIWVNQVVGETPILNALLLTYGLPIIWSSFLARELPIAWANAAKTFMLVLGFMLVSFEVRQLFHGAVLNDSIASNAEIYSYSIIWLMFGLCLLFYGTLRSDKMIRVASLLVMILTVGKVFLYDASELEGLFRVFSFFGLGLSLLGLSWFYTRYVFGTRSLLGEGK